MSDIPSLRDIAASLPLPPQSTNWVETEIARMHEHLNLPATLHVLKTQGVFAPIHAKKKSSAKDADRTASENESYFSLLTLVIFWWHNIQSQTHAAEQLEFIQKQPAELQSYWAGSVANLRGPTSKQLLVECLRRGFQPSTMELSWREHSDFWGELADIIPVGELPLWDRDSRNVVLNLLPISKDETFRYAVTRALYNDPDTHIRRGVRARIAKGILPQLREDVEDLFPTLDSSEELARTRALWAKLKHQPLPDSLRTLDPEKFVNVAALDELFRREVSASLDQGKTPDGTFLDMTINALDLLLNSFGGRDRKYLVLLHELAIRERQRIKIQ